MVFSPPLYYSSTSNYEMWLMALYIYESYVECSSNKWKCPISSPHTKLSCPKPQLFGHLWQQQSSINFCHANWNTYPEDAFLGRHAHHIFNDEVTSCYYNVIVKRCNKTFFVELCCMMIYHLSQNCKCTLGGWKIWSSQQKVLVKDIFHEASS